jgi:hypothetical protein|tara:strand:+ start:431 stop:931 length:501 start_codon:yes stop_codon:yes gene_type:complete
MKKIILIFAVVLTACNPSVKEEVGAGFFYADLDEKFVVGSDDAVAVWNKYIDAHNNRDIMAIMSLESDSIRVDGPLADNIIIGKEAHEAFLNEWFVAASPKWEVFWSMPYKGTVSGAEWIVAGHSVKMKVDGVVTKTIHMIDAEIKNGLVNRFFVYERQVPADAEE